MFIWATIPTDYHIFHQHWKNIDIPTFRHTHVCSALLFLPPVFRVILVKAVPSRAGHFTGQGAICEHPGSSKLPIMRCPKNLKCGEVENTWESPLK
jgi:hypothetical protein